MPPVLDSLPPGSRVRILRFRSLGDCVLTTPALALLKAHRPDLRVEMVVEPRFAAVFEGNPDVDEISIEGGIVNQRRVNRKRSDLVLNLHGGTRSMLMTLASGAKFRAGFAHHRGAFLYTHKIPRAQEILHIERKVHTAEHVASAMFFLGVPQTEVPRAKLFAPHGDMLLQGRIAAIHPFASAPEKTWPLANFVALADHLQRKLGLRPVFVPGPGEPVTGFGAHGVMANLPITKLKLLMSEAELFVGNDSGPAHVAAAYGVPSVVLFGPTDPDVWRPWRTEGSAIQVPGGIAAISVQQVLREVEVLRPRKVGV
ncbi:MAG TPA: glycosyltransferase family 9 protein [Bryobacteraceae bacterium]|nr:glycosyltransferase family 9 protein [Bryobacteraceae bacterium]